MRQTAFLLAGVAALAILCPMKSAISAQPGIYNVTDYGAKCDGRIIYAGISTTAGSGIVSSSVAAWSISDVGSFIDISVPTFNSQSPSPIPSFNGTITGIIDSQHINVSNFVNQGPGTGTLTFPTFTSTSGAGARWYHTDDTSAIQAALNAASSSTNSTTPGGAKVFIPSICVTGQLTVNSNIRITGSDQAGAVLLLANGKNSDILEGANYNTLVGSNSTGGIHDVILENLTLDGNRGGNTGSGIGAATGTGDLVRFYGYHLAAHYVTFMNQAADGWFSQWSTSAGSPIDANNNIGPAGMEADLNHLTFSYGAGWGMVWDGPHDSRASYLTFLSNGTGGFSNGLTGAGSPITLSNVHGYQEPIDISLPWPYGGCDYCYAEGEMYLGGYQDNITNSSINNLVLGTLGGSAVYKLFMINDVVTNLDDITGSGFEDAWVGGQVVGYSGSTYTPWSVFGTLNMANSAQNNLSIINGGSYRAVIGQSSGSVLSVTNNVSSQTWDAAGNVTLGPGTLTTTSTYGFPYMPVTAGQPTGVPTAKTGFSAYQYDTTNHKLWIYDSVAATWKYVQAN